MAISRRDLLRTLALGGAVVAGELWIPGQKLISIPSGVTPWTGFDLGQAQDFSVLTAHAIDAVRARVSLELLTIDAHGPGKIISEVDMVDVARGDFVEVTRVPRGTRIKEIRVLSGTYRDALCFSGCLNGEGRLERGPGGRFGGR